MDKAPGQTTANAKARYTQLATYREPFLRRARKAARFTIPTLMLPEGHDGSTDLPDPIQSLGSRGVSTLAAKLLLALYPPNMTSFKFPLTGSELEVIGEDATLLSTVQKALADVEQRIQKEIETGGYRPDLYQIFMQLINNGNTLAFMDPEGGLRVFSLDTYVCRRNGRGKVMELIVKEMIDADDAPVDVEESAITNAADGAKEVELYTHVKWVKTEWKVYQEIGGIIVPDSVGTYPKDKTPWIALRFTKVHGSDYGRSHVENYIGDLVNLEDLTGSITATSKEAARIIRFVKPSGLTDEDDVRDAKSGDVVTGDAADVTTLQLDKYPDLRIAAEQVASISERLGFAFLLNTAVQRSGERVTAAEVRYMAGELEDALGGVYSVLSQELQLPFIEVLMVYLRKRNAIPKMPKNIKPSIVTGLEALGRTHDLQRLDAFVDHLNKALGPRAQQILVDTEYAKRVGTTLSVELEGLVKTPEQLSAEADTARQDALMSKAAPNAVNAIANQMGNPNDGKT